MPSKPPPATPPELLTPIEQALRRLRAAAGLPPVAIDAGPTQAELSLLLRAAIERAALKSTGSMEHLRLAVCAFTTALRDEGMTPEAVLILFKAAIHQQVMKPAARGSHWGGQTLQDTLTTWCINDYFSELDCTSRVVSRYDRHRRRGTSEVDGRVGERVS